MQMNLKNVINVRTLSNGQFEVRMVLSEKKVKTKVTVLPHTNAGEPFTPEDTNQNVLPFSRFFRGTGRKPHTK